MKKLLFLLLIALMCTACSSSHRLAGEAPSKQDPTVEGGMNNESQHTKFSSYNRLDENDQANYTDIYAYIRSHVSGTWRGPTSINSGTEPLYIVDGIQVSSLDGMRPIDVYSVEFIKDASASIYGFRGVNGVFNIVTKAAHHQQEEQAAAKKAARTAKKAARKSR